MDLVFLYGAPGVGKLTVARDLARLTGYKLFDNHARFDFARRLFDYGSEGFWQFEQRLSRFVLDTAIDAEVSLISTFTAPNPGVMAVLNPHLANLAAQGGRACFVGLSCDQDVLETRVQSPGRAEAGKLVSVRGLRRMLAATSFGFDVPSYEALLIDNTTRSPEDVARAIAEHYQLTLL